MISLTDEKSENIIAFMMGGLVAEELVFDERTNGASNDIERATQLAHQMVCNWGMSKKMGPRNYDNPGANPWGGGRSEGVGYSEQTSREIDQEIHEIIDRNYKEAVRILTEKRDALDRIAEGLILWETLDHTQVEKLVKGEDIGSPIATDKPKKTEEKQAPTDSAADGDEPVLA